jgi:hypothetical protein
MTLAWQTEAREKLSSLSGLQVQDYSHCEFGRECNPDCISVVVQETKANNPFQAVVGLVDGVFGNPRAERKAVELMKELRKQLPTGLVVFIGTTRWLGDFKPHGVELVVGPGQSQLDIIRHARSDACNYDLTTEDLVAKLAQYDKQIGIDITHAETDTIHFELLKLPDDLQSFAGDLYEFCPDLVDQGCGSLDALAEQIKQQRRVCLWWD